MAAMYAVLPAVDLVALDLALDAAARTARAAGDTRTTDQLRADALATVGHGALASGWLGAAGARRDSTAEASDRRAGVTGRAVAPGTGLDGFRLGSVGGRPPRIHVTVPLAVLVGADSGPAADAHTADLHTTDRETADLETADLETADLETTDDDAAADPRPSPPPRRRARAGPLVKAEAGHPVRRLADVAVLDGYGPISPDVARALALGGTWRRLVTDPLSGVVLDVGRRRYAPPPDLADLVRARDRYCVRPGCGARAQSCDLDHTVPFHQGGRTAVDNLGALCASDHALKTAGGYRVEQPAPGVFEFHLPSGHSYRRELDGSTSMLGRRSTRHASKVVDEARRSRGEAHGRPPF
jgi:hypothetical protein